MAVGDYSTQRQDISGCIPLNIIGLVGKENLPARLRRRKEKNLCLTFREKPK
jgi:hypothetical protein